MLLHTSHNCLHLRFEKVGLVRSQIHHVTALMAKSWREQMPFERQRILRPTNIARLTEVMVSGHFIQGTIINIAIRPDSSKALLNGNHTLEAISSSGLGQTLAVIFHDVADDDEAGKIYAVLDTQFRRSWGDSIRSIGLEEMPNMPKILSAIKLIKSKFGQGGRSSPGFDDRVAIIESMEEWRHAANEFAAILKGGTEESHKICRLSPIMAVALYVMRHQSTAASTFWEKFSRDEALRKGDPAKALWAYCRNNRDIMTGGGIARAVTVRAAVSAWNAAFKDEQVDMLKPRSVVKFVILGTPLHRGFQDSSGPG